MCSGLLWGAMVASLGKVHVGARSRRSAVHCASWLLKYVPGQVGSVANKVVWSTERGISRTLVIISFVYENVFLLLGSIVPSVVILVFADAFSRDRRRRRGVGSCLPLLVAVVPLLLVMDRRLFHRGVNLVGRRALKRDVPPEYFLPPCAALRYQLGVPGAADHQRPRLRHGGRRRSSTSPATPTCRSPPRTCWRARSASWQSSCPAGSASVRRSSCCSLRAYMPVEQAIVLVPASRGCYSTVADAVVAGIYALLRARRHRKVVRHEVRTRHRFRAVGQQGRRGDAGERGPARSARATRRPLRAAEHVPRSDAEQNTYPNLTVVDASPLRLGVVINSAALLHRLLPPLRAPLEDASRASRRSRCGRAARPGRHHVRRRARQVPDLQRRLASFRRSSCGRPS